MVQAVTALWFLHRKASLQRDFPCQLSHSVPCSLPCSQWLQQWAVPSGDAYLHIPASRPERVQRGLQELHWEGPNWAGHHGGIGASRWVTPQVSVSSWVTPWVSVGGQSSIWVGISNPASCPELAHPAWEIKARELLCSLPNDSYPNPLFLLKHYRKKGQISLIEQRNWERKEGTGGEVMQ